MAEAPLYVLIVVVKAANRTFGGLSGEHRPTQLYSDAPDGQKASIRRTRSRELDLVAATSATLG
jgi:hypothetical protein